MTSNPFAWAKKRADERTQRAHQCGIPVEYRADEIEYWERLGDWFEGFLYSPNVDFRIAPGIEVREKWGGYSTASPWGSPDKFQFAGKNGYEWRPVETKPSKQVYEEAIRGWAALRTYVIEHAPARERDALMSYTNAISDALVASPAEPAGDVQALRDALQAYVDYDVFINGPTGDPDTDRLQKARAALAAQPSPVAPADVVWEQRYCESRSLVLHPGKLYRFTVDPKCESCVRMGAYHDAGWRGENPDPPPEFGPRDAAAQEQRQ